MTNASETWKDTGLRARKVHQQTQTMRKSYQEWRRTSPETSITKRQRIRTNSPQYLRDTPAQPSGNP